ncbi:MAG: glycosyltransferase, partial [Candidatus Azambacteria bacterium]|nr:glycosyltransferase [Candidatus Azambacteria bacterium]
MKAKFNKISIIIPVFNEARTFDRLLELVESVDVGAEKEIIIIDDCSTDGTREKLQKLEDKYR